MAPEVYKGEEYGPSVDIYSLGIVLYRYLNNNRTPFLKLDTIPNQLATENAGASALGTYMTQNRALSILIHQVVM